MMPKWHLFYGGIFSLIFFYSFNLTPLEAIILFLSTWFFIDLDLVPLFIIKKRIINPFLFWEEGKKTRTIWINMKSEEKKKLKYPPRIFHSIEFCIILFLLQFIHKLFLWVLVGFTFHLLFDYIDQLSRREEIIGKLSLIFTIRRNRGKKDFFNDPSFLSNKHKED